MARRGRPHEQITVALKLEYIDRDSDQHGTIELAPRSANYFPSDVFLRTPPCDPDFTGNEAAQNAARVLKLLFRSRMSKLKNYQIGDLVHAMNQLDPGLTRSDPSGLRLFMTALCDFEQFPNVPKGSLAFLCTTICHRTACIDDAC